MEDAEARGSVEYLAGEYLRLRDFRRHRHFEGEWYDVHYAMDELLGAGLTLDYLARARRDPYETLRKPDATLLQASNGLSRAEDVLRETGFLDLLDDHLALLMSRLQADSLPASEGQALRQLGFTELADSVRARAQVLGDEWRLGSSDTYRYAQEMRQNAASSSIARSVDLVDRHRAEREEAQRAAAQSRLLTSDAAPGPDPEPQPEKSRRWWKGLGQVVQGASLALVDVGMAVGVLHFPVSPETQTYGAVMSVTAGIGTIMSGVGDLFGE